MLKQIQSLPANCHNRLYCCYLLRFLLHTLDSQHAPIALHSHEPAASSPLICQPPVMWFNISHVITTVSYMFIHQSPCANFSHPDPCHMTHVIWKLLWVNMTCYWVTSIGMGNDMNWAMLIRVGIALKVEWWVLIRTVWWCHGSISGCSCTSSHN